MIDTGERKVITYVTYLYPGSFFPEESSVEVSERDPQRIAAAARPRVFAFRFHDQVTATAEVNGQKVQLVSRAINESGLYYIDAEPMTAADVEALPGDHSVLLSNMRSNRWNTIVRCRTGNFRPLENGDQVIRS